MSDSGETPLGPRKGADGEAAAPGGGAQQSSHVSLEGLHGTVNVPDGHASFWRNWRAFVGPAILISVGYMDPGNWGTDLQGGAQFKYGLLWVVALASLMAVILQVISARLGVATGTAIRADLEEAQSKAH